MPIIEKIFSIDEVIDDHPMMEEDKEIGIQEHFPLFRQHQGLLRDFVEAGKAIHLSRGHQIYMQGDACQAIAFLFSGAVRVFKCSESGREILFNGFLRSNEGLKPISNQI